MAGVAGLPNEHSPKVLLVQKEIVDRGKIAQALRDAGFEVAEADSGISGIENAIASSPDLLLVDLHLPDLDGVEVATKLRRLGLAGLPIVGMGQLGSERGMALSAGCNGTVPNPPDLHLLPGQVREFLAGKRDRLRVGEERRYLRELTGALSEKLEDKVRQLTLINERLRSAGEFKTEFMKAISHELSSPLTPLVGYLRILQSEKLGLLNERQKRVVYSMQQSAERLSRTIDSLADFVMLEIGQYRVRAELVNLVGLVQKEVEGLLISQAKAKRVHIYMEVPGESLVLQADSARFSQAIRNLVENAVKFSPRGGNVLVEIQQTMNKVAIAVYDQGAGVSPEDQERIFEPFHPAKGAQYVASVGLGLPVARKIAEAHGGNLYVESPPKVQPESERLFTGAKFVLELPI